MVLLFFPYISGIPNIPKCEVLHLLWGGYRVGSFPWVFKLTELTIYSGFSTELSILGDKLRHGQYDPNCACHFALPKTKALCATPTLEAPKTLCLAKSLRHIGTSAHERQSSAPSFEKPCDCVSLSSCQRFILQCVRTTAFPNLSCQVFDSAWKKH